MSQFINITVDPRGSLSGMNRSVKARVIKRIYISPFPLGFLCIPRAAAIYSLSYITCVTVSYTVPGQFQEEMKYPCNSMGSFYF